MNIHDSWDQKNTMCIHFAVPTMSHYISKLDIEVPVDDQDQGLAIVQ